MYQIYPLLLLKIVYLNILPVLYFVILGWFFYLYLILSVKTNFWN